MEDFALKEVQHLRSRAMIAKARGDHDYREVADRYLALATSHGYPGHIAAAKAMM
jgi:adenylate cyclase